MILTKNGQLALVTGSPGGRTIPNTVLDVVLAYTAFKLDVRQAVDAPRLLTPRRARRPPNSTALFLTSILRASDAPT